ncbi:MAG: vWA domain-containing protein [Pirellulales bacterium]
MKAFVRIRPWWKALGKRVKAPPVGHISAWFLSLLTHVGALVVLALVVVAVPQRHEFLVVVSSMTAEDPLALSEEFSYAEIDPSAIGASSEGDSDALVAVAPTLAMTVVEPSPVDVAHAPAVEERIQIQEEIRLATGPNFAENLTVKGIAGVGVSGATGAVDRITQEILLSLEERKTLVVWFFDQSGSLESERGEIIERFDRVYEELGVVEASGNPAFKQHDDKPLLSAVVAFGQQINFLTSKPTDDVEAIKSSVANIETDSSGVEQTFTAVREAADRFRVLRTQEPRRNVMFVIFTDEIGDDEAELDEAVTICRRYEIPVYCVGVPAPFGRREVLVRYVDPDPQFDQTPQWLPVRQGPESYLPELVKISSHERDDPLDSGFGPYSLARLCYETGGIFFTIRGDQERRSRRREATGAGAAEFRHSFDPQIMFNYRPDYVPIKDYQRLVSQNKARAALVQAAQMSWIAPMEQPQLLFPKTSDAELANRLTLAQRAAAVLEPRINQLYDVLKQGERDRDKLTAPRWQVGYDLSMGLVLALRVRTESYNAMLAKAKTGMKFENAKSDTWILAPADEISVGSGWEKMAADAKANLERVVHEHPQTPWAVLAEAELKQPLGWTWKEAFTGVAERQQAARNPPPQRPPRNDSANKLSRPVKRPPPKL